MARRKTDTATLSLFGDESPFSVSTATRKPIRRTVAAQATRNFLSASIIPSLTSILGASGAKMANVFIHGDAGELFSIEFGRALITTRAANPLHTESPIFLPNMRIADILALPETALSLTRGGLNVNGSERKVFPINTNRSPANFFHYDDLDEIAIPDLSLFALFLPQAEYCICQSDGTFAIATTQMAAMVKGDAPSAGPERKIFVPTKELSAVLSAGALKSFAIHQNNFLSRGEHWQVRVNGSPQDVRVFDPAPLIEASTSSSVVLSAIEGDKRELPEVEFMTLEARGRDVRLLSPGFTHTMAARSGMTSRPSSALVQRSPVVKAIMAMEKPDIFVPNTPMVPWGARSNSNWVWSMPSSVR